MEEKIYVIKKRLKESRDRKKSYADAKRLEGNYEAGDMVFVRVRPNKSPFKFGKAAKLAPRFVGPFKIIERIGSVAYRLELPPHLGKMHDVFHISVLRHYISDPTHVLKMDDLQLSEDGAVRAEPQCILDQRTRKLRIRTMDQVKVQWDQYSVESATWEDVDTMCREFPYLF